MSPLHSTKAFSTSKAKAMVGLGEVPVHHYNGSTNYKPDLDALAWSSSSAVYLLSQAFNITEEGPGTHTNLGHYLF